MDALKSKGQMLDQIDLGGIPRSGFDRSFNFQGTGTLGRLYPVRCEETLPGDRWQGKSTATIQFQPLAVPMISNMYSRIETFKIPSRTLWKNWEKFITGGEKLDDNSRPPVVPFDVVLRAMKNQLGFRTDIPVDIDALYYIAGEEQASLGETLVLRKRDLSSWISSVLSGIRSSSFADKYQCRDLLAQSIEVLENLQRNLDSYFVEGLFVENSDYTCIPVFAVGYSDDVRMSSVLNRTVDPSPRVTPGLGNFRTRPAHRDGVLTYPSGGSRDTIYEVLNALPSRFVSATDSDVSPDTYTYDLLDFLPAYLKKLFPNNSTAKPYVFSTEFVSILQAIYDYIKPLFGIGSNLDFLGAGCIGMDDYIVHCYAAAYVQMFKPSSGNTTPAIGWNIDDGNIGNSHQINILPFRALYSIWYWYYRDQLLETSALEPSVEDVVSEQEICVLFLPRFRCWSKDTFTTALTNTGTGSMFVKVDSAPFDRERTVYKPLGTHVFSENAQLQNMDAVEYVLADGTKVELPSRYLSGMHSVQTESLAAGDTAGFSLDMLNRAQRMQKWLQKALIYGNRPQDSLWTHWRVRSSDARLQLPEYIAGESSLVRLDTITNNTTTSETVAGDKAANAYGYFDGMNMNEFCEEHGFIISLFSIMPELSYGYGLDRKYVRLDKFDYAWPEFAQIGMDAVYNRELVCPMNDLGQMIDNQSAPADAMDLYANPFDVFGYQGRYFDYKCKQDEIHGDLLDTMDVYTFARKFGKYGSASKNQYPALNYQFVHCHPRLDMFVNDSLGAPVFWFDIHHAQAVERALPVPSMSV